MAHTEKMSFKEFREKFSSESACKNYLYRVRWPEGYICPKCGCREFTLVKCRGGKFQCRSCRHQTTLTAGTVMHSTHLPMTTWFWAIYLVARDKRGISATQLAAELDDFYFGGPDEGGKRGRGTGQSKIMIALSKSKDGKPLFVKMQVVDDLKVTTVGAFAHSSIAVGSTIQSDAYRSYRKPLAEDFDHQYSVYDSDSDMLHWLHMIIGNLKAFLLGTYHGNCNEYLQTYLDEFSYRFNRRNFKNELFTRLLNTVSQSNILGLTV